MDEPIATYNERLLEVRREFALHKDRVVVKARWLLKGKFETTVKLETLSGQTRELTIRYRLFRYAGWVMALAFLAFAMVYYNAKGAPLGAMGYATMGLTVLASGFMAITFPNRRIRFVRFEPKSGRGGLDIGRAGNSVEAFREFVDKVSRQIRKNC